MPQTRLSYSLQDAAEQCGLSAKTLERAIHAGDLRSVKPTERDGKRAKTLILHSDLMAWLTGDKASA